MTDTLLACRPEVGGDPAWRGARYQGLRTEALECIADGVGAAGGAALAETALFELSIGRGRLDGDDPNGGSLRHARNP
jgi:hypothetical protein